MSTKLGLSCVLATLLLVPFAVTAQEPQAIRWEPTLENAQRMAGQSNRLVLIHFWAPWCGVCKRMEAEILTQPAVIAESNADYISVKVNADQFPVTARRYGITALPTTVIVSPQGQMLDSMKGWVEADQYVARLGRIATENRQRTAAYAQIPAGAAPPAAVQPPQTANPPMTASSPGYQPPAFPPTGNQPPNGQPSRYEQPGNQPPATPAVPAGRYDAPATQPSIPPAYGQTQPAYGQAQPRYGQTPSPVASPSAIGQPPVSNAAVPGYGAAPAAPAYGSQAAPPANNTPPSMAQANPPQNNPVAQPSIGDPAFGLDGFCPVSLCEKQKWVSGDKRWGAVHRGKTYLFIGPDEQRRFLAMPDRYAPAASGNDIVVATEQGRMMPGKREHGVFFGNQIYLFSSEESLQKFSQNPNVYAKQALEALRSGAHPGQQLR